jgi:hypothetical protein
MIAICAPIEKELTLEFERFTIRVPGHRFCTLVFLLFLLTAAGCAAKAELAPDGGMIAYAIQHTPRDYPRVNDVTFAVMPPTGGEGVSFSLPLQQPIRRQLGEYHVLPCPRWTNDGQQAAFNDGRNITLYDAGKDEHRTISLDFDLVWHVAWSADNQYLAFAGNPSITRMQIWLVDVTEGTFELAFACDHCDSLAWRPDGKVIAFYGRPVREAERAIVVLDPFAKTVVSTYPLDRNLRIVPRDAEPAIDWSPDGERLAFTAYNADAHRQQVFILTLASGSIERVTSDRETADSPQWSPSGEQLLYRSLRNVQPHLSLDDLLEVTNFHIVEVNSRAKFDLTQREVISPILACPQWLSSNVVPLPPEE